MFEQHDIPLFPRIQLKKLVNNYSNNLDQDTNLHQVEDTENSMVIADHYQIEKIGKELDAIMNT